MSTILIYYIITKKPKLEYLLNFSNHNAKYQPHHYMIPNGILKVFEVTTAAI